MINSTKERAKIATELMEENEHKSTEWCASIAADMCQCEYIDIIDALIKHPDISGFKQL